MNQPINRRGFLRFLGTGAAVAATDGRGAWAATVRGSKKAPNVLFIMTDEQHWRSLSITGNRYITTPNMDRIAREGALFSNATCVTPYCSPTRASIITGLYPTRHGVILNVENDGQQQPLSNGFPVTEALLNAKGWKTFHKGKWHLGNKAAFGCYENDDYAGISIKEYERMLDKDFPTSATASIKALTQDNARPVVMIPAMEKAYKDFTATPRNKPLPIANIGRSTVPSGLQPETLITDRILGFLDQNADERFMATVSWGPPHNPWVVPEPYYSMVDRSKVVVPERNVLDVWDRNSPSRQLGDLMDDDAMREYIAIYHGMVKYIDDQLGRILTKLDEKGIIDNTLIIFTTDHGDMVGAHGCVGKSVSGFYDDLVRIPLVMRLPGVIQPGTIVDAPVCSVDLMPTILDIVGEPIPQRIDGRSMLPLLQHKKVEWRDYAYSQRRDNVRMLRTAKWKYCFGLTPKQFALYDLEHDPGEMVNLAREASHAGTVKGLHKRLLAFMREHGDPTATRWPDDPLAATRPQDSPTSKTAM